MTELFGISLTWIMIGLLALLAIAVATVAYVAIRNRVLFSIGLRNIPRRPAQSVLIVLGLMLSTVIVSAAFATGDTVNYSITNETYNKLGHVDELLQVQQNRRTPDLTREQITPAGRIPPQISDLVFAGTNGNDDIDGVLPALRLPVPATNTAAKISAPEVVAIGLDERFLSGFEDDITAADGTGRVNIAELRRTEVVINASTARTLSLLPGDQIDLWIKREPRTFRVRGIVNDTLLTGWTQGQPNGVVMKLSTAQTFFGIIGAGMLAISNRGGVRDSVGLTAAAEKAVRDSIGSSRFEVNAIKSDRIERAKELGSNMTAIFVVLGLFSIAAGLLLVFLILVMLAAERRPEMGMSRAIGMRRVQLIESFMAEGMAYSLTSAVAGAALGVLISLVMARAMAYIFHSFDVNIVFHLTVQSLVISYCLGVVLTFVTLVVSAWRISNMSIVAAIREVNEPPRRATGREAAIAGALVSVVGIALTIWGLRQGQAYAFGAGVSLIAIGAAFVSRSFALPERPVFTVTSAVVLILWGLIAGDTLDPITGKLNVGIETFFISGVLMVAAATFIVIYNADLFLSSMRVFGVVFARAVPAVRTAIAYPLANKFRTGMTIAMMSLVIFALVMISTMSLNFQKLFLSSDSRGGWDVEVSELPTNTLSNPDGNPLGPLGDALQKASYDTANIDSVGRVLVGHPSTTQITQVHADRSESAPHSFQVLGADQIFLDQNTIGLQARAKGYATDGAVWDAVRDEANNAIIDGSAVPGINYGNVTQSRFTLDDYESGQRQFAPFPLVIQDSGTTKRKAVRIIGIMNRGPSETYNGIIVSEDAFNKALPPLFSRYYVRMKPGVDAESEAASIQAKLAQQGISAHSIKAQVEKDQRLNTSFFYLIQGFMALGLFVGIASLGVIAFRTVVERRQQIGLMRAIGFSRASIALSFVLESAFVALLGIVNGIWLALLLASRLLSSSAFKTAGFTSFFVPWTQIGIMALLVFVVSVLTTLIPSRQASSIPIAEALRYE
ncbi:MAG: FtsX-like permease family protein [Chloroflexota bacterium]|nr:FtsX-like permease family protein [Chloroflexota bacterium]